MKKASTARSGGAAQGDGLYVGHISNSIFVLGWKLRCGKCPRWFRKFGRALAHVEKAHP